MKRSFFRRIVTSKILLPLMAGGIALQLGGCDTDVKNSILSGVQSSVTGLVTTVIGAVFSSLENAGSSSSSGSSNNSATSQPIVQAPPQFDGQVG
jgi:hypothetical protein